MVFLTLNENHILTISNMNKNECEFIPRLRDEIRRIGCIEKIDNIETIGRIDELREFIGRELVELRDLGELVVLAVNW